MTGPLVEGRVLEGRAVEGRAVQKAGGGSARTTTWVTFEVAGDLYGIDVRHVQEVLADQPVTPVPLARPDVAGLVNLRGQVVTALDLRRRLDLPAPAAGAGAGAPHVVVRAGEDAVSLVVDALGDVVEVADEDVQPPPDTLTGPLAALVTGACPLPDRLLLPLDVDALVSPAPDLASPRTDRPRTDRPRTDRPRADRPRRTAP